jgi:hypothetical protein
MWRLLNNRCRGMILSLALIVFAFGSWFYCYAVYEPYDSIRTGMTEAEVQQILGDSAGEYRPGRKNLASFKKPVSCIVIDADPDVEIVKVWSKDTGELQVCFDKNMRVNGTSSCKFSGGGWWGVVKGIWWSLF